MICFHSFPLFAPMQRFECVQRVAHGLLYRGVTRGAPSYVTAAILRGPENSHEFALQRKIRDDPTEKSRVGILQLTYRIQGNGGKNVWNSDGILCEKLRSGKFVDRLFVIIESACLFFSLASHIQLYMKNAENWSLKGYDIEIDRTRSVRDAREKCTKSRVDESVQRSTARRRIALQSSPKRPPYIGFNRTLRV